VAAADTTFDGGPVPTELCARVDGSKETCRVRFPGARRACVAAATAAVALAVLAGTITWVASSTEPTAPPLSSHLMFGASVPDLPSGRSDLPALEGTLGANLRIASAFVDWTYVIGGPNEFWMADSGARNVLLSWEPRGIRFTDVTTGQEDAYLQRVANSMLAFPNDIYVRPWPEMNANWSSWQPTTDGEKTEGGTPAQFVAAWRYLVNYFRSRGVTNLKFVFNPDASNSNNNSAISSIWPGASYVDVLGIDGYNWGNDTVGESWRSFDTIFSPMYGLLTRLDATHPVWICETASKEPREEDALLYPSQSAPADPGNSKGTWIDQMLDSSAFPRVQAVVWFNKKKERDWPITSSSDALGAIQSHLAPSADGSPTSTATPRRAGLGGS
jgi:hypothetical protein